MSRVPYRISTKKRLFFALFRLHCIYKVNGRVYGNSNMTCLTQAAVRKEQTSWSSGTERFP